MATRPSGSVNYKKGVTVEGFLFRSDGHRYRIRYVDYATGTVYCSLMGYYLAGTGEDSHGTYLFDLEDIDHFEYRKYNGNGEPVYYGPEDVPRL